MHTDLVNGPIEVQVDGKEYLLEYNYSALFELEKVTEKGVCEIYDRMMSPNGIKLDDTLNLMCCAMMKHHKKSEILELKEKVMERPYLILCFRQHSAFAFMTAIMLPEAAPKGSC